MPPFTKRAIVDSFLKIAAKKSFDKITVRDIVDECGVNRNTFYYYFQDIYAVVEELCESEVFAADEDEEIDALSAFSGVFMRLCRFTLSYRRAVQNIYASMGRDGMEDYLFRPFDKRLLNTVKSLSTDPVSEKRLSRFAGLCRHMLVGLYIDWLKNDCKEDPEKIVSEFSEIFGEAINSVAEALKNSGKT